MVKPLKARAHIIIEGRVQGVFYRSNTKKMADKLGVKGWIRNLPDGRVEAVFEGEKEDIKKLLSWCWVGPPGAKVTNIEVEWEDYVEEFKEFSIIY